MAWPIAELARMSGVTARTLRHYDEIGLLPPARIGSNGHRYYEERQLLRLPRERARSGGPARSADTGKAHLRPAMVPSAGCCPFS
jgi:hypothetical protein